MKKGLIMEGGAMRGMFTAGVIDVMMAHGIELEGAIGVSAGAAFGCNYKSRQIGRVIRYNTRFCQDKRYGNFGVLLKTGNFYSKEFCYEEVPMVHDVFDFDTYECNPMEFYVVATDVETGKAVYHKLKDRHDHGFEWIRASASMPLVSRIVEIDGGRYLDGALADSIPVQFFESIGYDRNIVYFYPNKHLPLPCFPNITARPPAQLPAVFSFLITVPVIISCDFYSPCLPFVSSRQTSACRHEHCRPPR